MTHVPPTPGIPKGRITLRMLWEHMQHNFTLVRSDMSSGFAAVRKEFAAVRKEMKDGFDAVDKRLIHVERGVRNIEAQLDDVEIEKMPERFKKIEEKIGIC